MQWEASKTQSGGDSDTRRSGAGSFFTALSPVRLPGSQPVADVAWSNAQTAFTVEAFFRNNDLVVVAPLLFNYLTAVFVKFYTLTSIFIHIKLLWPKNF